MLLSNDVVAQTATNILMEFNVTQPPVDVMRITTASGLLLEAMPSSTDGVSGMLIRQGNCYGILYATHIENERFQRFSIAHELGHYFLSGHYEAVTVGGVHKSYAHSTSKDHFEREANFFASALLMPRYLFGPAIEQHEPALASVCFLSDAFETSLQSTAIEYVKTTSEVVALIVSTGNKVDYAFLSDALLEYPDIKWPNKGSTLPETMTRQFNIKRSDFDVTDQVMSITAIQDWFGGPTQGMLCEEIVGLGASERTLTLLTVDDLPSLDDINEDRELVESWIPGFK